MLHLADGADANATQSYSSPNRSGSRSGMVLSADILSHKLKKGGTDSIYAVYIVQCAINGSEQWLLEKRYSDFRRLYKSLASKNLSPQSCSFPKKKWLFNLSQSVLEERKQKFQSFLGSLLLMDPVPLELLTFLESRERLTAFRFLDKERQSLGSAQVVSSLSAAAAVRSRITSTGSLVDDVTVQDFAILKVLGQGSFGRVYLVRPLGGQASSLFAMKVLRKAEVEKRRQVEHTLTERHIMATMQHWSVLSLRVAFQSPERLFMLTDYCPGGELFYHLKRMRRFTEDMMRFYCAELTVTIDFLHSRGVIYRDLKPENVLLDREGHIKLTDFGLSKVLHVDQKHCGCRRCSSAAVEGTGDAAARRLKGGDRSFENLTSFEDEVDKAYTFCGTPEYLAPEMLLHRHKGTGYGKSIDWWALGIVCFELMTGWPPFFDKDFEQMSQKILMKPLRFPSKYGIRQEAQVMMRSLLERDPASRLPCCAEPPTPQPHSREESTNGLRMFKNMPFFKPIDWDAIENRSFRPPFLPPMIGGFDDTSNFDKEFTDINISVVSIEGATICRPVPDAQGQVERPSKTEIVVLGENGHSCQDKRSENNNGSKHREDHLRRPSLVDNEAYKDFNYFDPSFRQSYLLGNASLLADDYQYEPSVHSVIRESVARSY